MVFPRFFGDAQFNISTKGLLASYLIKRNGVGDVSFGGLFGYGRKNPLLIDLHNISQASLEAIKKAIDEEEGIIFYFAVDKNFSTEELDEQARSLILKALQYYSKESAKQKRGSSFVFDIGVLASDMPFAEFVERCRIQPGQNNRTLSSLNQLEASDNSSVIRKTAESNQVKNSIIERNSDEFKFILFVFLVGLLSGIVLAATGLLPVVAAVLVGLGIFVLPSLVVGAYVAYREKKEEEIKVTVQWLEGAATFHGDRNANYILGLCYENGVGVTKDLKDASIHYYLAAKKGHTQARTNLVKLEQQSQIPLSDVFNSANLSTPQPIENHLTVTTALAHQPISSEEKAKVVVTATTSMPQTIVVPEAHTKTVPAKSFSSPSVSQIASEREAQSVVKNILETFGTRNTPEWEKVQSAGFKESCSLFPEDYLLEMLKTQKEEATGGYKIITDDRPYLHSASYKKSEKGEVIILEGDLDPADKAKDDCYGALDQIITAFNEKWGKNTVVKTRTEYCKDSVEGLYCYIHGFEISSENVKRIFDKLTPTPQSVKSPIASEEFPLSSKRRSFKPTEQAVIKPSSAQSGNDPNAYGNEVLKAPSHRSKKKLTEADTKTVSTKSFSSSLIPQIASEREAQSVVKNILETFGTRNTPEHGKVQSAGFKARDALYPENYLSGMLEIQKEEVTGGYKIITSAVQDYLHSVPYKKSEKGEVIISDGDPNGDLNPPLDQSKHDHGGSLDKIITAFNEKWGKNTVVKTRTEYCKDSVEGLYCYIHGFEISSENVKRIFDKLTPTPQSVKSPTNG